jgi:hypothetical protein
MSVRALRRRLRMSVTSYANTHRAQQRRNQPATIRDGRPRQFVGDAPSRHISAAVERAPIAAPTGAHSPAGGAVPDATRAACLSVARRQGLPPGARNSEGERERAMVSRGGSGAKPAVRQESRGSRWRSWVVTCRSQRMRRRARLLPRRSGSPGSRQVPAREAWTGCTRKTAP